jgi:hypothetical protein
LLQRCLANHPAICSTSESWLLLPGAYALRQRGVVSEYGHSLLQKGVTDFCVGLPEKEKDFLREYGDMVARLYTKRFGAVDHRYFLEKTPRNYLIIDEIFEMFPTAKFILLWRNPVRVYASIVRSFLSNKWKPGAYNIDLTDGFDCLCSAVEKYAHRIKTVKYEDFVLNPGQTLMDLTGFLELKYHDSMTDLADSEILRGRLGDKTGVVKYKQISAESLESDLDSVFFNSYRARCMKKLIQEWEAKGYLTTMGYSGKDLIRELPTGKSQYRGVMGDLCSEYLQKLLMLIQSAGLLQALEARQKMYY